MLVYPSLSFLLNVIPCLAFQKVFTFSSDQHGWRRALKWVCGVNVSDTTPKEDPEEELTPEEKARRAAEFLVEKSSWKTYVVKS